MASQKFSRRAFMRVLGLGSVSLVAGSILSACTPEQPETFPDVEIALKATSDEVQILPGTPTRVWRYKGEVLNGPDETLRTLPDTYLGPTFQVKKG